MSLWYALGPAAFGTVIGQWLIARAMRDLDPGQAIATAGDGPDATLGGFRWVMAGVALTSVIFALSVTLLAWIEPGHDFATPLVIVGGVGGLTAIVQCAWVAWRLPAIAADPSQFGKALVVEAAMEIPLLLAMVNFFLAHLRVAA